jgi:hypothetical protein
MKRMPSYVCAAESISVESSSSNDESLDCTNPTASAPHQTLPSISFECPSSSPQTIDSESPTQIPEPTPSRVPAPSTLNIISASLTHPVPIPSVVKNTIRAALYQARSSGALNESEEGEVSGQLEDFAASLSPWEAGFQLQSLRAEHRRKQAEEQRRATELEDKQCLLLAQEVMRIQAGQSTLTEQQRVQVLTVFRQVVQPRLTQIAAQQKTADNASLAAPSSNPQTCGQKLQTEKPASSSSLAGQ